MGEVRVSNAFHVDDFQCARYSAAFAASDSKVLRSRITGSFQNDLSKASSLFNDRWGPKLCHLQSEILPTDPVDVR